MFIDFQKLCFEHREVRPKVLNNTFERTHSYERVGLFYPWNAAQWERRENWERRERKSLKYILQKGMLLGRANL